jgi:hypothetical protein
MGDTGKINRLNLLENTLPGKFGHAVGHGGQIDSRLPSRGADLPLQRVGEVFFEAAFIGL